MDRLKDLQDVLGAHQDSVVTREVLRRQALRAYADGENRFTYGVLYARQAAAADRDAPAIARAARPGPPPEGTALAQG